MTEFEKNDLVEKDCCCGEQSHKHEEECCCGHEHNHKDSCGCGCNEHDHDTIVLTLEDDTELECAVIGTFVVEDREYIALVTEEDEQLLIYRYTEVDEENFELDTIESEDEFERAMDVFFEEYGEDDIEE